MSYGNITGPPRNRFYDIINIIDNAVNYTALAIAYVSLPILLYLGSKIYERAMKDIRPVNVHTLENKVENK
jgi:hypothetical protein